MPRNVTVPAFRVSDSCARMAKRHGHGAYCAPSRYGVPYSEASRLSGEVREWLPTLAPCERVYFELDSETSFGNSARYGDRSPQRGTISLTGRSPLPC